MKVGKDIFLVFSPERAKIRAIPTSLPAPSRRFVEAIPPACLEVGLSLYGQVIDRVVPVSSTRAAELTKLLENIHRAVNIGLYDDMQFTKNDWRNRNQIKTPQGVKWLTVPVGQDITRRIRDVELPNSKVANQTLEDT